MRLIVHHKTESPLVLPLGYHHILQSILFHALKADEEYSAFMHDEGIGNGVRNFKMFTFGLIKGKYRIEGNKIVFCEDVTWEVRSKDQKFLELIKSDFEENGITYENSHYSEVQVSLQEVTVEEEEIVVRMQSPICVYSTDQETKKTIYFHPGDPEFCKRVNESFRRRYSAYYDGVIPEDIYIRIERVSPRDKYVTRYKGFYITAWKGDYVLKGKKEYLDFLYQTGLGSKTAQGFGMFEIL